MNFEKWLKELLENLDRFADEKTKKVILEKCGEKCPFSHMPDEKLLQIRNQSKSEQDFLDKLSKIWRVKKINKRYFVIFEQCYCPLVNKDINKFSKSMCFCTLGSLKHKFKISLGKDIKIEMLKTILSGDDECKFEIKIY